MSLSPVEVRFSTRVKELVAGGVDEKLARIGAAIELGVLVGDRRLPSSLVNNEADLAYDPLQPRDTKGRWVGLLGAQVKSLRGIGKDEEAAELERKGVSGLPEIGYFPEGIPNSIHDVSPETFDRIIGSHGVYGLPEGQFKREAMEKLGVVSESDPIKQKLGTDHMPPPPPRKAGAEPYLTQQEFMEGWVVEPTPLAGHSVPGVRDGEMHISQMPPENKAAKTEFESVHGPLLRDENGVELAVGEYRYLWAYDCNGPLRKGKRIDSGIDEEILDTLEDTFDNRLPTLDRDLTVYRSANFSRFDNDLQPGDRFVDKGFTSTSLDPGVAETARRLMNYNQLAAIEIPKGSHVMYATAGEEDDYGDAELVIRRGGEYEVVENNPKAGRLRLRLVRETFPDYYDDLYEDEDIAASLSRAARGKHIPDIRRFADWGDDLLPPTPDKDSDLTFDPNQPRDEKGRWLKIVGRGVTPKGSKLSNFIMDNHLYTAVHANKSGRVLVYPYQKESPAPSYEKAKAGVDLEFPGNKGLRWKGEGPGWPQASSATKATPERSTPKPVGYVPTPAGTEAPIYDEPPLNGAPEKFIFTPKGDRFWEGEEGLASNHAAVLGYLYGTDEEGADAVIDSQNLSGKVTWGNYYPSNQTIGLMQEDVSRATLERLQRLYPEAKRYRLLFDAPINFSASRQALPWTEPMELTYNPLQERDERGRWSSGATETYRELIEPLTAPRRTRTKGGSPKWEWYQGGRVIQAVEDRQENAVYIGGPKALDYRKSLEDFFQRETPEIDRIVWEETLGGRTKATTWFKRRVASSANLADTSVNLGIFGRTWEETKHPRDPIGRFDKVSGKAGAKTRVRHTATKSGSGGPLSALPRRTGRTANGNPKWEIWVGDRSIKAIYHKDDRILFVAPGVLPSQRFALKQFFFDEAPALKKIRWDARSVPVKTKRPDTVAASLDTGDQAVAVEVGLLDFSTAMRGGVWDETKHPRDDRGRFGFGSGLHAVEDNARAGTRAGAEPQEAIEGPGKFRAYTSPEPFKDEREHMLMFTTHGDYFFKSGSRSFSTARDTLPGDELVIGTHRKPPADEPERRTEVSIQGDGPLSKDIIARVRKHYPEIKIIRYNFQDHDLDGKALTRTGERVSAYLSSSTTLAPNPFAVVDTGLFSELLHPRDLIGRFAHGNSGSSVAPDSLSTSDRLKLYTHAQRSSHGGSSSATGDKTLSAVASAVGLDAKPRIASPKEVDAAIAAGATGLVRGGQREHLGQWATGEYHAGIGAYGSGTYYATGRDSSKLASRYAKGGGATQRGALVADARIVGYNRVLKLQEDEADSLSSPGDKKRVRGMDPGVWAALHGYDAIDAGTQLGDIRSIVVLNRGKLLLEPLPELQAVAASVGNPFGSGDAVDLGVWEEIKHPRDRKGRFTSGGLGDVFPNWSPGAMADVMDRLDNERGGATTVSPPAPVRTRNPEVGDAMREGAPLAPRQRQMVQDAISAIASVHSDGVLPKIGVYPIHSQEGEMASYDPMYNPPHLNLADTQDTNAFSVVHETGHFLDHFALGTGSDGFYESEGPEQFASFNYFSVGDLMDAIDDTPEIKKVQAGKAKVPFMFQGMSYEDYLDMPQEKFARAYSQWIATRSGSAQLQQQMDTFMREEREAGSPYQTQWSDESFRAIGEALDDVFRSRGWLK